VEAAGLVLARVETLEIDHVNLVNDFLQIQDEVHDLETQMARITKCTSELGVTVEPFCRWTSYICPKYAVDGVLDGQLRIGRPCGDGQE